jgi:hypothetical protein
MYLPSSSFDCSLCTVFYCFILTVWCHFAAATATFYACREKGSCGFFQWTDEPPRAPSGDFSTSSSTTRTYGGPNPSFPPALPQHQHQHQHQQRNNSFTGSTVNNNSMSGYGSHHSSSSGTSGSGGFSNNSNNSNSGASGQMMCRCGAPSVCLQVKKDGPNLGRRFHVCAKSR